MHHGRLRALNPRVLHHDHTIAHAGNEIDKVLAPPRLRQPHRIGHLAFHARFPQTGQRGRTVRGVTNKSRSLV